MLGRQLVFRSVLACAFVKGAISTCYHKSGEPMRDFYSPCSTDTTSAQSRVCCAAQYVTNYATRVVALPLT